MRKLLKLVIALFLIVIIGIVGALFYIDAIAKSAIERGSTYALGVNTTLDSADVQILGGQLELTDLNVANPQGFKSDHFLDLAGGDVQVTLNSLRQDLVHVPHLRLTGADLILERTPGTGEANYRIILDNLKKLQGDQPREAKRFIIDELVITDLNVHVNMLGLGEIADVLVPTIREIKLTEVGAEEGRGVTISELSGLVLKAILAAAVEQGAGRIPDDVIGDLRSKLAELADLDKLAEQVHLGEIQRKAEELGVPKEITDRAQEELDKAKGKLEGLLNGEPKEK